MTAQGPAYGLVLGQRRLDIPAAAAIVGGRPAPARLSDFVAGGDAALALGNRLQTAAVLEPGRFEGAWRSLEGASYLAPST